jgi:hypothetical protein
MAANNGRNLQPAGDLSASNGRNQGGALESTFDLCPRRAERERAAGSLDVLNSENLQPLKTFSSKIN